MKTFKLILSLSNENELVLEKLVWFHGWRNIKLIKVFLEEHVIGCRGFRW